MASVQVWQAVNKRPLRQSHLIGRHESPVKLCLHYISMA